MKLSGHLLLGSQNLKLVPWSRNFVIWDPFPPRYQHCQLINWVGIILTRLPIYHFQCKMSPIFLFACCIWDVIFSVCLRRTVYVEQEENSPTMKLYLLNIRNDHAGTYTCSGEIEGNVQTQRVSLFIFSKQNGLFNHILILYCNESNFAWVFA